MVQVRAYHESGLTDSVETGLHVAGYVVDVDMQVLEAGEAGEFGDSVEVHVDVLLAELVVAQLVQQEVVTAEAVGHDVHTDDLGTDLVDSSILRESL